MDLPRLSPGSGMPGVLPPQGGKEPFNSLRRLLRGAGRVAEARGPGGGDFDARGGESAWKAGSAWTASNNAAPSASPAATSLGYCVAQATRLSPISRALAAMAAARSGAKAATVFDHSWAVTAWPAG